MDQSPDCIDYNIKELIKRECHAESLLRTQAISSLEEKTNLKFESAEKAILLKAQQELVIRRELDEIIRALKTRDESLNERMNFLFGALLVALFGLGCGLIYLFMQHMNLSAIP